MELKVPTYPNLEAELSRIGWNYKKFGNFLGLKEMQISRRMRNQTEFSLDEAMMTCDLFKKDVRYLFQRHEQE